ncbi:putative P450 monooxygenase [Lophiotrema nucula]|uniref:Putative P450 monooxygenase n=1 Tax=Lophiotrema nucula TaxID=690887 RepID=A0A6A5Z8L4_9PLEO|nr:putative P450 monooxygenase [Lophiotrema nucula]
MTFLAQMASFPVGSALVQSLILYTLYGIGLALYRIWFSPLSKFPGPKLAAATLWYEFYFDVIKRGRFAWEIKRLHEVYGPIVRINPFEIHIADPDFYDEIYTGNKRKRNLFEWSADQFAIPESMLSTVSHDLHRRRRAPIAPFFTQHSIRRFDPVIRSKLDILCSRLEEYMHSGQPVNMDSAYAALTTDIITEYCFGVSYGYLEQEGFNPEWLPTMLSASESSLLHKQIPWITTLIRSIPNAVALKLKPEIVNLFQFQAGVYATIKKIRAGELEPSPDNEHPTIFHSLFASDLPASDLTPGRLMGEGQTVVAAGTLTTAHYLKTTTYYILANPEVLRKLKAELEVAMPKVSTLPALRDLEDLPYLSAVVNEGFRTSHGVIARLTRVAPDEDLHFYQYVITAGTPVGMSSWLNHLDPTVFHDPDKFIPERWLEPDADRLKKYLVNFAKGTRMCLGKDLAKTEIVYTLALLFRKYEMELFKTDQSDVDIAHDFFNPSARLDSKGVRVIIKKSIV